MNHNLLKQRQEFMRRQIGSHLSKQEGSASHALEQMSPKKKKKVKSQPKASSSKGAEAATSITRQQGIAIMARIVTLLRNRHLKGKENWPLTLHEAIEELPDPPIVAKPVEKWLVEEALPNNPRVHTNADGKILYKPPYSLKNRVAIQQLLQKNYQDGKGGILLTDLNDSIQSAEQNVKAIPEVIDIPIARKEHVYFHDDPELRYGPIDEEFVRLWKSISVEHSSERAIEEYLAARKIAYAKDSAQGRQGVVQKAQKKRRRQGQAKIFNIHLEGILADYGED